MTTFHNSQVRGRVARFTMLDHRGVPVVEYPQITTKGVVDITVNEVSETTPRDALRSEDNERRRLLVREKEQTIRYTTDLTLCGTDPLLIEMLTGQPVVINARGEIAGNDADPPLLPVSFAVEVWSKLAAPVGGYSYGHTIFPRLRGGRVEGFRVVHDQSVSFHIVGAISLRNNHWDENLWNPEIKSFGWDRTGWDTHGWDAEPLDTPAAYGKNVHWRNQLASHAPEPNNERELAGFGLSGFGLTGFGL